MKPKKNTVRWRLPNLDESDYIWLENKILVGVEKVSLVSPKPLIFLHRREVEGYNQAVDDFRTHIKELFEGDNK